MIRPREELRARLAGRIESLGWPASDIIVERPARPEHGDWASPVALALARLSRETDRVERAALRLPALAAARVDRARAALDASSAALEVLGPQATLDRGYAIVRRTSDGRIVRAPDEAPAGTALAVRLADGELDARSEGPVGR